MSIRTNPMKAVPTLLKRLVTVEKQVNLKELKDELIKIKDLFSIVKRNEEELLDTLMVVDGYLRNFNIRKLMQEKQDICQRIRNSTLKLLPAAATQSSNTEVAVAESLGKTFQDVKLDKREEENGALSLSQLQDLEMFQVNYNNLTFDQKHFFFSLLLFPENAVINKRNLILWWNAVDFVIRRPWHSRVGRIKEIESVFVYLLNHKLIVPYGSGKCPVMNKFKINPWVRHKSVRQLLQNEESFRNFPQVLGSSHISGYSWYQCLALDQKRVKLRDGFGFKPEHWRAVFNVGASYLNFEPQWMAKMKRAEVLQLGHWLQGSDSHHIEVVSEEFLKELKEQKHLKYLSFRGISRISELPPSFFQLESLETLDLKACYNLQTLPNDISSLRKLRHLDLSQCYLLERIPKGMDKLHNLEVLKGFVIGSSSKTPSRIHDLANLEKLERLSIYIGIGAVIQDGEFESLRKLTKLKHLKISWIASGTKYSDVEIILPSSLKKLHLEGFPGQEIPQWLKPNVLHEGLKELFITGGKLESMNRGENNNHWHVEIVRLKYLKHLKVDITNLQKLFPLLRYVEIKRILNHSYFEWSID